jgi:hypothetical protein
MEPFLRMTILLARFDEAQMNNESTATDSRRRDERATRHAEHQQGVRHPPTTEGAERHVSGTDAHAVTPRSDRRTDDEPAVFRSFYDRAADLDRHWGRLADG